MAEFEFNTGAIKRIYRNGEKNTLTAYHYTSPNALLSIIKDGFIRFSDIEYMNDKSETVYAVKVLLDFLDNHPGEYLFTRDVVSALIGQQSYAGPGLDPWVWKIPWRREWQPTPLFLPEELPGQRSLAGYSPWGCKELGPTERLIPSLHFSFSAFLLET